MVQGDADPARGYLVIGILPSDRAPHISVKRGRVLHRVGTHNKPMTRREIGAAFAAAGEQFAIEFGLARGHGSTGVMCELTDSSAGVFNTIKVINTGLVPATDISLASTTSTLLWAADKQLTEGESRLLNEDYVADPVYLPVRTLAPGSSVLLDCRREWGSPAQDVLRVMWTTPDGQVHRAEQSWSWRPMGTLRR